jgi:DNA-binding transcriptional ArsR family regulator
LAARLQKPLGHVSYHVRELQKAGAIELVDERKVRGAVEHFYRGVARLTILEDEWAALDPDARAEISSRVLQNIFGEAYAALHTGTLDSRMDRHLTWRSVSLDEEGWQELADLLLGALFKIEEIEGRSMERRLGDGAPSATISAVVALMSFERGEMRRA